MKLKFSVLFFCGVILAATPLPAAITVGPFGIHGEGGTKNGQNFLIGSGGSVFELDAFVNIAGRDLNGTNQNQKGTSAQLSRDSLPAGLVYTFSSALSPDQSSLVLTYALSNATSVVFSNVVFFAMLDAEIDQAANTFFNEYGSVKGVAGHGAADGSPDQWQIDEPGFQSGKLFDNLFLGTLSNSNSIPQNSSNDVAMALGFTLGDLNPGGASDLHVMISENGSSLGSLALVQRDSDPASKTFITFSGGLTPALEGVIKVVDNGLTNVLTNVTVCLQQTNGVSVTCVTTDGDGRYNFPRGTTLPGVYSVKVDYATLPLGVILVPVAGGATNNPTDKTLVGGQSVSLDWDFKKVPALEGVVFVDAPPTNGVPDAGEGLTNVTVLLLQTNGVTVTNSITDGNGRYLFPSGSVSPGVYSVKVDTTTLPPGLTFVPVELGATNNGATNNPTVKRLVGGELATLNWEFKKTPPQQIVDVTALVQWDFGPWQLNRASGSLYSTLSITNPLSSGADFGPRFRLGLPSSSSLKLVRIAGTNDGVPYMDLSAVSTQLGGGLLTRGRSVTNVVEVFSLTLTLPSKTLFKLWATP